MSSRRNTQLAVAGAGAPPPPPPNNNFGKVPLAKMDIPQARRERYRKMCVPCIMHHQVCDGAGPPCGECRRERRHTKIRDCAYPPPGTSREEVIRGYAGGAAQWRADGATRNAPRASAGSSPSANNTSATATTPVRPQQQQQPATTTPAQQHQQAGPAPTTPNCSNTAAAPGMSSSSSTPSNLSRQAMQSSLAPPGNASPMDGNDQMPPGHETAEEAMDAIEYSRAYEARWDAERRRDERGGELGSSGEMDAEAS